MSPDQLVSDKSDQMERPRACEICHLPEKYRRLLITKMDFWKVGLYANQFYPGRTIVTLKRHSEQSIARLKRPEFEEFVRIYSVVERVAASEFGATRVDWFNLQNIFTHTHVHLIPRPEVPVKIGGILFKDPNWSGHYSPYDRNFTIPQELEVFFIDKYRSAFELEDSSSFLNSF